MAGENFQKRATAQTTPPESTEHQVRFEPQRFNSLIHDKGYDVFIDRAFRCPCAVANSGQALTSCNNCLGRGWLFTNRIETRLVVQGIKADVKYENWSKTTAGTAKITARAVDKLAFMDRIILTEVEGYYNEILRTNEDKDGNVVIYTEYPIIEIETLFLFDGDKKPLKRLIENEDYTVEEESKIKLIVSKYPGKNYTLSIRYRHYMTYHIIDMNRDIMKVRTRGCVEPDETQKEMPISGIARKAHYLFDNLKYDEEKRLLDND